MYVCSHIGAILLYIEALQCAKTCTDITCQWVVPTSVKSNPYAKIADTDFTRPKSKIVPLKLTAHHNTCCQVKLTLKILAKKTKNFNLAYIIFSMSS